MIQEVANAEVKQQKKQLRRRRKGKNDEQECAPSIWHTRVNFG
jgi:hypothetical protein